MRLGLLICLALVPGLHSRMICRWSVAHDDNLGNIFDEQHLPSLNSPLESPTRSANSSVSVEAGAETPPRRNSGNAAHQLGLPANELEEADWRNDSTDLRARKEVLLQM